MKKLIELTEKKCWNILSFSVLVFDIIFLILISVLTGFYDTEVYIEKFSLIKV